MRTWSVHGGLAEQLVVPAVVLQQVLFDKNMKNLQDGHVDESDQKVELNKQQVAFPALVFKRSLYWRAILDKVQTLPNSPGRTTPSCSATSSSH